MIPPDEKRCTATTKKTGERCKNYPAPGLKVCRYHGGSSKKARAAGQRRQAEALMQARAERILRRRLGMRLNNDSPDPAQILLNLVAQKAVEVEWLDQKIQQLETDDELFWGKTKHVQGEGAEGYVDQETHEAAQNIIYALLHKAQDQLAKYTSDALRAGIEERQTKMAEQTAQQFSWILNQLITRLGLTQDQQTQAGEIVLELMQAAPTQTGSH